MPSAAAPPIDSTPVPSPCISICKMDPHLELCTGCLRTIDEIAGWTRYSEADKRTVWQRISERRARL